MKQISFTFVIALLLAAGGCKKKGTDCAKAIDNSMTLAQADMQKMPGMNDAVMAKLKDVGVQHCKDDKWPQDAVTCMVDAKTQADAKACYAKLSPEQQGKMNKASMDVMQSAMASGAAGSAMGEAGSAAAGSAAAGSAEAGSAAAGSAASPK